MFSVINPWLLAGLGAVAAPVLIHLLLRRRPQPLPWGAMRWLRQALERSRRRLRLSQLLLLLLRCLLIACVVLAAARPHFAAWGRGGDILLVIDCSASMGDLSGGVGGIAAIKAQLSNDPPAYERLRIVALGGDCRLIGEGDPGQALAALDSLTAEALPGGIDSLSARDDHRDRILALCRRDTQAVLVSDFRQDDGAELATMLAERAASVSRWRVGETVDNCHLATPPFLPDLTAEVASSIELDLGPRPDRLTLSIDGAAPTPIALADEPPQRIDLPPLSLGEHRLRIAWSDPGLVANEGLDLPLVVRPPLPVLVVDERPEARMPIALGADPRHSRVRRAHPANLANEALPEGGLVVLHAAVGEGERLRRWLEAGGRLWASPAVLGQSHALAELLPSMAERPGDGGPLRGGEHIRSRLLPTLDNALASFTLDEVASPAEPPSAARVLLWAGDDPAVIGLPQGAGTLILDLAGLTSRPAFWDRVVAAIWARETIRDLLAERWQTRLLMAGSSPDRDLTVEQAGNRTLLPAGEPCLLPPGVWQLVEERRPLVILPSPLEMDLHRAATVDEAAGLPPAEGIALGLPLAVLALLLLLTEGAVAAWTGARHARAA